MEWPATDQALAELVNNLPAYFATISYLIVMGVVICAALIYEHFRVKTGRQDSFLSPDLSSRNTSSRQIPRASDLEPAKILKASDHASDGKHHLLLAATGSVATIKIPSIVKALSKHKNLSIRIVLTESAENFLAGQAEEQPSLAAIQQLPNVDGIYRDADEWLHPWTRGASILHIELRRWADLMVIAPLSANGLAKISAGFSDNLIYSVARAWDTTGLIDDRRSGVALPYGTNKDRKGIMVAPAMNTAMWNHPATAKHLSVLEEEWNVKNGGWFEVLRPMEKELACGDIGSGAMKDWNEIVDMIELRLGMAIRYESKDEKEVFIQL